MRKRVACGSAVALLLAGACKKPQILVPQAPEPPSDVVAALARAYQTRDVDLLASLLCSDPATNTEFAFLFEPAHTNGETQWGWDEETRLHRRMFHPELPAAGEPPLPPALWLDGIEITFTPLESFQERRDLYSENGGVDGKLDPQRWRAVDARHATYMLFDGPDKRLPGGRRVELRRRGGPDEAVGCVGEIPTLQVGGPLQTRRVGDPRDHKALPERGQGVVSLRASPGPGPHADDLAMAP